jgi:hypothetical protein
VKAYYRTAQERRSKEALVGANTARAGYLYRLWLRVAVRRSLRTGGDSHSSFMRFMRFWILPHEFTLGPKFSKAFGKNPGRFGEDIAHYGLNGALGAKIELFREGDGGPFLVVRDLLPCCHLPWSYTATMKGPAYGSEKPQMTKPKWYMRRSYYDLIGSALLAKLGVQHRSRTFTEENAYRDYFTVPGAEIDQFGKDEDVPRRWRQAIPEFALVDEPSASSGNVTARYAVYLCVENPIKDPLWLLPVHYVVDALSEEQRKLLRHIAYEFFDHWYEDLSSRGLSSIQKILGGEKVGLKPGQSENYNKWMSFDANRLNLENSKTQQEERGAVGALRTKLVEAARQHAIPVMLRRGDVLIVDNYRTLIRRTELCYRAFNPWLFGRPAVRWLRMYCGFPPTPTGGRTTASAESTRPASIG